MERLDKILAWTGRWSRREAAELIRTGRVTVDGSVAWNREEKFPETACFRVNGEEISSTAQVYLMLNKPEGLVSATNDPRQPTVLSMLPEPLRRMGLFPAGRLDKDTVGLLLLTNDGPLAHRLLSPRRHVDKTYLVRVDGVLDEGDAVAFREGMVLESGLHCLPALLELRSPGEALVTLREGKYHQIKRMLASRGKPVTFLKRLSFGPLTLDKNLAPGAWRPLSDLEREALQRAGTLESGGIRHFPQKK